MSTYIVCGLAGAGLTAVKIGLQSNNTCMLEAVEEICSLVFVATGETHTGFHTAGRVSLCCDL